MDREHLLHAARSAALHAYVPFSKFRVGAALIVVDDQGTEHVVTGCNVENASYGLAFCAERNALATAVTQFGEALSAKPCVTQIAVSCIDAPNDGDVALRSPCGACRQWIAELAPDAEVFIDGYAPSLGLNDLLPIAFRLSE